MKYLIIGLLVVGSVSAFAGDLRLKTFEEINISKQTLKDLIKAKKDLLPHQTMMGSDLESIKVSCVPSDIFIGGDIELSKSRDGLQVLVYEYDGDNFKSTWTNGYHRTIRFKKRQDILRAIEILEMMYTNFPSATENRINNL